MKKLITFATLSLLISGFVQREVFAQHDLFIWEVYGNGNPGTATLIVGPDGTVVLYDAGQTEDFAGEVMGILDEEGIDFIDYVVVSHYDNDHCGGLADLVDLLGGDDHVGAFYDRGGDTRGDGSRPLFFTGEYLPLVAAGERHIPELGPDGALELGRGAALTFLSKGAPDFHPDDLAGVLEVYDRPDVRTSRENNKSITALLSYGGFDMYIGGDAEGSNERAVDDVIRDTLERGVDVTLIDHHGSDTHGISSREFFWILDPEIALISCWNNPHGHPRQETVENVHDFVETGAGRQTIFRIHPGDVGHASWAAEDMFPECHTTNSHILITTDGRTYTVSGDGIVDPELIEHEVDDPVEDVPDPELETDIVLIVDRSNSMNDLTHDEADPMRKIDAAKLAAEIFVDIIEPDDGHRMSIVRFGSGVEPFEWPDGLEELTLDNVEPFKDAVRSIETGLEFGWCTCYGEALGEAERQMGAEELEPAPRRIVHLLTDGKENKSPWAGEVYPGLAAAGVEIHSTGFGADGDIEDGILREMADACEGGTYARVGSNCFELSRRFIDVARDAMNMDFLCDPPYTIGPGRPAKDWISTDASTRKIKFILSWRERKPLVAQMDVVSPNGVLMEPGVAGVRESQGTGYTILHVDLPRCGNVQAEGNWRIVLSTGPKFEGKETEVDLNIIGDTDIDFRAEAAPEEKDPRSVRLLCEMANRGAAVPQAWCTATWKPPAGPKGYAPDPVEIPLYDDGYHGDGKAYDGLFGAYLYLQEPGCHNFQFVSNAYVPGEKLYWVYPRREAFVSYTVGQ